MSALLCGGGFYRIVFQSFSEIDIKDAVQASCEVCTAMLGFIIVGWEAVGLSEQSEEEEECCRVFLFNAFGVAHGGVAAVLHRSVAADITDGGVAAVLHGPVAADISDGGMIAVLHRAVVADIADGGVTAVLHGAVIADITDSGVVAVVHCAVLHVGCGCVVAVLYGLCR